MWCVLLVTLLLATPVLAQQHSVTLTAGEQTLLEELAQVRGQSVAQVLQAVVSQGLQTVRAQQGAQTLQAVQDAWGALKPQAQAQLAAQVRTPGSGTPLAGTGPPPGGAPVTLGAMAGVFLGVSGLLGWGWQVVEWVLWCMGVWLCGYLAWEFWPCRRLLWGVTRRLYGRRLED